MRLGQTDPTAGAKTSYLKTLTILGLGGALVGTVVQSAVIEKPSVGTTLLSTLLGAATVLIPYGFWLRTGGKDLWPNPAVDATVKTSFAGVSFKGLPAMQVPQVPPPVTVRQQWI